MGLSGLFRPLCFPLWLSVESRVLEIVGLESGLRLIIAVFLPFSGFPSTTLASRGRVAKIPYFPENISLSGIDNRRVR